MHRTEGDNNSSNLFVDGPPGTRVEKNWLNAVQEELAYIIEQAGITLKTASTETSEQLFQAINLMIGTGAPGDFIFLPYKPTTLQMIERRILEGNGGSILDADYPDILTAWAGKIYGNADGTHFNLPALGGYFPRFFDNGVGVDPDAATRTDRGDGTAGDNVGTIQSDEFKSHIHTQSATTVLSLIEPGTAVGDISSSQTGATGGDETRGKNIYIWGGIYY